MPAKEKEPIKEISISQLAKQLKKPYWTVRREILAGQYPGARKVGHGWVVPVK